MDGWGERKIDTLSKGMTQKVQFVAAVVSQPELLILDEPFSGPRPGQRRGAQGRRPRDAAPRHDRRLQHPRHGDRREDVRPHLHDLQGREGARRHARGDPGAVRLRHRARAHRRRRRGARRSRRRASRSTTTARSRRSGSPAIRSSSCSSSPRAPRCTTSRSPARRCTTSSSASPGRRRLTGCMKNKALIVAISEFTTLVQSKAFIVGLLMMPIFMGDRDRRAEVHARRDRHQGSAVRGRRSDAASSTGR